MLEGRGKKDYKDDQIFGKKKGEREEIRGLNRINFGKSKPDLMFSNENGKGEKREITETEGWNPKELYRRGGIFSPKMGERASRELKKAEEIGQLQREKKTFRFSKEGKRFSLDRLMGLGGGGSCCWPEKKRGGGKIASI